MFELFVALKYLVPRKRSLSSALVSLLSVGVISVVVWLVLIFLSVTTGIEKNWIHKLTSLNAPLRLTPTDEYFHSYYYQIDQFSNESDFSLKTIGEKAEAKSSNPYVEQNDPSLPEQFSTASYKADGALLDPVKKAYEILQRKKLVFQDYEISGALLKLSLFRGENNLSYLSQMSYLLSLPEKNPRFASLLLPPSSQDLNFLYNQVVLEKLPFSLQDFFGSLDALKVKIKPFAPLPLHLLSHHPWQVQALWVNDQLEELLLSEQPKEGFVSARLVFDEAKNSFLLEREGHDSFPLSQETSFFLPSSPLLEGSVVNNQLFVHGILQSHHWEANLPFQMVQLEEVLPKKQNPSPWATSKEKEIFLPKLSTNEFSVLLPKSMQQSGVLIGDRGTLSYASSSLLSAKEQRIPIYVAGFYDTGVLPIGNRFLVVPKEITRTINGSSMVFSPDGTPSNGIYVWFDDEYKAEEIKKDLLDAFAKEGIDRYWKISTFREYEFSKDLMQQFQSDRTLFILIALIILVVACSNIISLLVLLVNDKKKEIAVLQSMGSSKTSIAAIFSIAGMLMGTISSLLGTVAAIFTLRHLPFFVELLSKLQGHDAFNQAFYGQSLPNELSYESLLFILIVTPLVALISGLIPAIKAAKLHPSSILRASE